MECLTRVPGGPHIYRMTETTRTAECNAAPAFGLHVLESDEDGTAVDGSACGRPVTRRVGFQGSCPVAVGGYVVRGPDEVAAVLQDRVRCELATGPTQNRQTLADFPGPIRRAAIRAALSSYCAGRPDLVEIGAFPFLTDGP